MREVTPITEQFQHFVRDLQESFWADPLFRPPGTNRVTTGSLLLSLSTWLPCENRVRYNDLVNSQSRVFLCNVAC